MYFAYLLIVHLLTLEQRWKLQRTQRRNQSTLVLSLARLQLLVDQSADAGEINDTLSLLDIRDLTQKTLAANIALREAMTPAFFGTYSWSYFADVEYEEPEEPALVAFNTLERQRKEAYARYVRARTC